MPPPFTDPHVEDCQKRIRALFGGAFVVDTRQAKLVWEHPYYPLFYFPQSEVPSYFIDDASKRSCAENATAYDIVVGPHRAAGAAIVFSDKAGDRAGLLKINFNAMDMWFEEEEQVYVHPKDPYKRVDVLQSSRHVRVEVDGVEVANTHKPRLLFETGLPVRTYIPKTDCKLDLLVPSELVTACPYKGEAKYYHVQSASNKRTENIVWWYRNPNLECAAINGYVAFYDEKVDVWVDGVKQERPKTHF